MSRSLIIPILAAAIVGGTGCSSLRHAGTSKPPACCAQRTEAPPGSESSVYELTNPWVNDTRSQMRLADLRGRPQVLAMFYSSCHVACPVTLSRLKQLSSSLPEEARSQVGFVLVTLDPAADTPDALASFRRTEQLPEQWLLLRGALNDTAELAAKLGVCFQRDSYRLVHSNAIFLLDSEGRKVCDVEGLHSSLHPLVEAVHSVILPQ